MPSATLTILATTLHGFDARAARLPAGELQRLLLLHEALLGPVFRAFDGRLIQPLGDGYVAAFASATKAALCGAAIQDRLFRYNRAAGVDDQIEVRIGIATGEVRIVRGVPVGEPVELAGRLEQLAQRGEVLLSERALQSLHRAEVPVEERGVHELPGRAEPVRVHRVRPAAGAARLAPYADLGLRRAGKLPDVALPQRWPRVVARARALPQLALAGAVACALLAFTMRGDPLERALADHDVYGARLQIARLPQGPGRLFAESRVAELRGNLDGALRGYAKAAQQGEPRALSRLAELTRDGRCDVRASAAAALGELGDARAVPVLRSLLGALKLPHEGPEGAWAACSSKRAARDALWQLRPGAVGRRPRARPR